MSKPGRGSGEKAPSFRALRVNENVRYAISTIISRGDIQDPDLEGVSITVSEVKVSPDLRNAVVYVMPLGGTDQVTIIKALNKSSGYVRGRLSKMVRMKYLPRLAFRLDESFDEASSIEKILSHPKVRRDVALDDGEDGT